MVISYSIPVIKTFTKKHKNFIHNHIIHYLCAQETDCFVHKGIYEAAKGINAQFMPEIIEHLSKHDERAKLQFTGHSLGGSLSLLST